MTQRPSGLSYGLGHMTVDMWARCDVLVDKWSVMVLDHNRIILYKKGLGLNPYG